MGPKINNENQECVNADKRNLKQLVSLLSAVKPLFLSRATYRPRSLLAQILVKNWILNLGDQFPMAVVITNVIGYLDILSPCHVRH